MATTLYFRDTVPDWSRGEGDANLQGVTQNWTQRDFIATIGASNQSHTASTVAGPVTGVEPLGTGSAYREFITPPFDADVTIAGSIVFNLWAAESNMSANIGIGCIIQRLDSQGAIVSTVVDNGEIGVELAVTTAAVRTESSTPTSTNMLKGDRLRARVYLNDAVGSTMASGFTGTFLFNGAAGVQDSYVTFTEDFGFLTSDTTSVLQEAATGGKGLDFTSSDTPRRAESFIAGTGDLRQVDVNLAANIGSPTDGIIVSIQADSANTPTDTVLAEATIASPTASAWNTVALACSLTAGTRYWVVFRRSGSRDTSNFRQVSYSNASGYTGATWYRFDGAWTVDTGTHDLTFRIYQGAQFPIYLTNTASDIDPNGASYDPLEAWTSRGGGVQSRQTTAVAGPTAPILATAGAGANFIEWFTKQLTAFTLDGLVACNLGARETASGSNAAVRCEIAVCASNGTSPVVWGAATDGVELGTTEAAMTFSIAGDATAITDGQRLRIRVYWDDAPGIAMAATGAGQIYYNGTSGGASGDTYITLPQTVTEYTSSPDADVTPTTVAATTTISATSVAANADTTPVTVTAQASVDTPTVSANANVTPTTVVAQVFIDTPTVTAIQNPNVTPTEVIGTTTIPVPEVVGNANAPPSEVAAVAAIPTPSITADAAVTTATVVAAASVDTPSVTADANVTPTTVTAQAFVDTPTVEATTGGVDANVTTTTVVSTTTIDGVSVTANADVTPTTVAAITTIPGVTVTADANVTTSTVAAQAFVDTPAVSLDANATTTTVIVQAFIDTPSVQTTGDAAITTATVSATTAVDTPTVTADANLTAGDVAGSSSVQLPTVTGNADITPTTVAAQAFLDTPAISLDSTATPTTVVAQAFVDTPSISIGGDVNITLATVIAQAAIDTPSVTADANLTTSTVTAQATVPGATVSGDANVTTTTVPGQATVDGVTVSATQNPTITLTTVIAQAFIDSPNVSTEGNANVSLATVISQAGIDTSVVSGTAEATAGTQAEASIPTPSVSGDANLTTSTIAAQATIPGATVTILASGDTAVTPDPVLAVVVIPGVVVHVALPNWEQTDGDGWPQTNEDTWPQTNEPAWSSSSGVGWPQTNDGGWE